MEQLIQKYQNQVVFFLAGIILVGLGVLVFKANELSQEPEIEILGSQTEGAALSEGLEEQKILVEVAGQVIKPGVYELENESRVNDLLTLAGGLSSQADREWVAKNINLAQKLIDGAKIYIPKKGEVSAVGSQVSTNNSSSSIQTTKINLNTANQSQLESLWGIGPVTAKKIIDERPFVRPDELLEKKIVKSNVWEKIKDQVSVY